jgi:hypothetical protein
MRRESGEDSCVGGRRQEILRDDAQIENCDDVESGKCVCVIFGYVFLSQNVSYLLKNGRIYT